MTLFDYLSQLDLWEVVTAFAVSFLVNLAVLFSPWLRRRFSQAHHLGLQNLQGGHTPRVGGLGVIAGMFAVMFTLPQPYHHLLSCLLMAVIPVFYFGLIEDTTMPIAPAHRLIASFLTGVLAWYLSRASITHIGLAWADPWLAHLWVRLAFTALAVAGLINAFNLIDGLNGLASGVTLTIFAAYSAIAYLVGDLGLLYVVLIMMASYLGFIVFNWPMGKIFLGDSGAYLSGFLSSWVGIVLVSHHPEVSPFAPLVLCIYPLTETMFSIARRWLGARSIMQPDTAHLHTLFKKDLLRGLLPNQTTLFRNSLASLVLLTINAVFAILAVCYFTSTTALILISGLFVAVYFLLYRVLSRNINPK